MLTDGAGTGGPRAIRTEGAPAPDREDRQSGGGEFRAVDREGREEAWRISTPRPAERTKSKNKQMGGQREVI